MPENIELPGASHNKTNQVERAVDTPADFTSPEELYKDLIAAIKKYHPSTDLSDIEKAYETARKAHEGQFRKSGEPYIIHPLCVAIILAELELDKESIIAGLLHDAVEDTWMTIEEVEKEFSAEVALLVDGVTKLGRLSYSSDKLEVQAENLRKMFLAMAKDIRVMSRARPNDKQRLVAMLQKRGEVVAVTGDGTNDAPALHYAHVGLSLGSGTSVAKEASDITLLDDSFKSIANAVMWGRSLYRNLQRFLFFQLVVNVAALLLVLGGSVIGTEMPLTVTQILWVNLIMDTFAALALASLPPSHEVMKDKPRKASDFIINKSIGFGILFCGIVFFLVMFALLVYCERRGKGGVDVHELTMFFTTFVMIQFWNLFNAKALMSHHTAFRHFLKDKGMILVLVLVLVGQWIIVTFGGEMFRTTPLSLHEWLLIIGSTSVVLWAGELWRTFKRMIAKRR